jgi:cold shock CspA family protein
MTQGTVKSYNEFRGYGFIKGDDGREYFVHYSFLEGTVATNSFGMENELNLNLSRPMKGFRRTM